MPTSNEPEDLALLRATARRLTDDVFRPKAAEWDRTAEPPLPNLKTLAENGLAGITIAEEYGGSGATIVHAVVAAEEVARGCPVTAAFILANCVSAELLQTFGTPAQRSKYLPGLAAGELMGAWAMTEPGAGSAAGDMISSATPDGDHFVLTGVKCFITRAAIADFFTFFARVGDEPGSKAIAAFLVDKDTPGLSLGSRDLHMGLRGGASAEVIADGCRVHKDQMVVAPGSLTNVMRGLNQARVLNPTICLGIAAEAIDLAVAHAQDRKAFGREISRFQGIQWMFADMATRLTAMRLMIYRAAEMLAADDPAGPHEAAMAKLFAGETAFDIVNKAMQIHGGYGYSNEFPLERMLRDVRAFQLGGGTNEILRNRIAAGIYENWRNRTG
jgi:alkylation response protein AidB-like acyl-CoA dehydrogenase